MDKLFILIIFGVQAILLLMSVITLKHKLNSLEEGIKGNKRTLINIEDEVLKNKLDIAYIRGNSNMIKDKLEEINKTIKDESAKNIAMHIDGRILRNELVGLKKKI